MKTIHQFTVNLIFLSALFFCSCDDNGENNDSLKRVSPGPNTGDMITCTADGVSFKMVYVEGGVTFPVSINDESTSIVENAYWIGETEVVNSLFVDVFQWARESGKISESGTDNLVSDATVRYRNQELMDLDNASSALKISYNTSNHVFTVEPGYENHPVIYVKWYGAVMFCNWLTEMRDQNSENLVYAWTDNGDGGGVASDGIWQHGETDEDKSKTGYRLPSAIEWECSARYIGKTAPATGNLAFEYVGRGHNDDLMPNLLTDGFYWTPGNYASGATKDISNDAETSAVAWCDSALPAGELHPVAEKAANQLGLYDMSGNAWEWCFTVVESSYRVMRGGSWSSLMVFAQAGSWGSGRPYYDNDDCGFRIVKTK